METRPLPAATALPLSVVTLAKNEAARITECLQSVDWADERIVVDDESADRTAQIAASLGARVLSRRMDIEGRHRNWAAQQARHDWILSVDADERVTPELAEEIQSLFNCAEARGGASASAGRGAPVFQVYSIPRRNFLGTRWLRHGGWYPSAQVKLYNRRVFRWEETTVHCRALSNQPWGSLRADLLHHSYRDIGDFLAKLNRQTTLEAEKWRRDGRRMTCPKAIWRTADRFFRAYLGKKGYRDGWIGFVAAVLAGLYQLVSFAKYWEAKHAS